MSKYPLEELKTIKKNRFDEAVRVLEEKRSLLAKEEEKLKVVERARDEVKKHKIDKLTKLRKDMDAGTSSAKILQAKAYLKTVDEKLAQEEKKVTDQQKKVDLAKRQVKAATDEMYQKKKDLEKLDTHEKEWQKEEKHLTDQKETLE